MVAKPVSRPPPERLLDACDELFYARGIAATGVDAVLKTAAVSPATLYAHFRGKDDLVAAYLERRHHRWREAWDETLERADGPLDRLLSVFDALHLFRQRQGSARGCAVLAAAAEVVDPAHPAHRWIEADTALLTARLHQLAVDGGVAEPAVLGSELLLIYDGILAGYARCAADGTNDRRSPWDSGRHLAEQVISTYLREGADQRVGRRAPAHPTRHGDADPPGGDGPATPQVDGGGGGI
jgi:AcrR family transcriptional regulator